MALTQLERIRRIVLLNAVVALLYEFDQEDVFQILGGCDLPSSDLAKARSGSGSLNPKGFWRIDGDKSPELRHTVLTQIAFQDLEDKIIAAGDRDQGIEAFLAQNRGEGWMPPETLRLADYGLGHDDRAQQFQPVASRLGPPLLRLATRPNRRRILARMPPPRPQPPRCRRLRPPPLRCRRGRA